MATTPDAAFERSQLQAAFDHCQEASALAHRLHLQLEHVLLGYTPEALPQLQLIHQRLSVVLARIACALEQLEGVLHARAPQTAGEARP